jgi:hypothetical protein
MEPWTEFELEMERRKEYEREVKLQYMQDAAANWEWPSWSDPPPEPLTSQEAYDAALAIWSFHNMPGADPSPVSWAEVCLYWQETATLYQLIFHS